MVQFYSAPPAQFCAALDTVYFPEADGHENFVSASGNYQDLLYVEISVLFVHLPFGGIPVKLLQNDGKSVLFRVKPVDVITLRNEIPDSLDLFRYPALRFQAKRHASTAARAGVAFQ